MNTNQHLVRLMMRRPSQESPEHDERGVFLSSLLAGRGERRLALTVVLASVVIFVLAAPFAKVPLVQVWAFIPIYESATVINDLITAVLLFGQFRIVRSRALLALASGYLFTAFVAVAHALTFPGLFSPTGLLGAGPQSTAWLYMFWHGAFPLFVVVYALFRDPRRDTAGPRGPARLAVLSSLASVLLLTGGVTLLATVGVDALPPIMRGNHYTAAMKFVVSSVWGLSLLALVVLWRRRPHSVLDLWLTVVMCVWLFDIALAAVLNAGRFDLGFYAGRIYGLLAASFVLVVLLLENGRLYAQLVEAHDSERQERQRAQRAEGVAAAANRALDAQNRSLEETVRERSERLVQSEKVAAMGSLLAGVAHELNNPLAALSGHAHLLHENANDPVVARRADKIKQATDRCVRIVRNFLALARQRPPERTDASLPDVVQGAVELLAYELRTDDVEIVVDIAPGLPRLWADPHQLHQVLVNLIANAHQAMRRQPPPRRIAITAGRDPARDHLRLEVRDTGPGIPPAVQARIFEPFFTTKPPGEGTGLGLPLCRGIIEEHGGTIDVDSGPGRGTVFVIELPVAARPSVPASDATVETLPPLDPKVILVVDDEADVAAVLAEALTRDGHQTDVATNGAAALEMLARRPYDLILSDTSMPVLDGEALFTEIGRRFPALRERIIFLTGDVLSREKREFLERSGAPFLTKPYDLAEARRLVHRVLVGHRGAAA